MKLNKFFFLFPVVLLLSVGAWLAKIQFTSHQIFAEKAFTSSPVDSILIVATGDAMMHMPQLKMAQDPRTGKISFDSCYVLIRPLVKQANLAMVNFETTLAGEPYSGYPRFSAPPEFAQALVNTGFNLFVFANNHVCDKGKEGIEGNISFAEENKLYYAGIYRSKEERKQRYPLIVPWHQWKIAVLNYTYGTNNIAPPKGYMVNYIDTVQIEKDIEAAKRAGADVLLCAIHWGEEYRLIPTEYQRRIASFLMRRGVRIIIGSHPHVIEPVERFVPPGSMDEHLIAWSMGNFISNQKDIYTDAAMLLFIKLYFFQSGQFSFGSVKVLPLWRYKNDIPPGYYLVPAFFDSLTLAKFGFTKDNMRTFYHVIEHVRRQTLTNNIEEYSYERNER